MKTVRHSARARVAAVGLTAAGALLLDGMWRGQRVRSGRRWQRPRVPAPPRPSPAPSPARAPARSRPRRRPGSPASPAPTPTRTSPTTRADPAPGAPSSSAAVWPSPAATRRSRTRSSPRRKTRCNGDVVEVPAYVSPIAVIYNLPGVTELQPGPGHHRADLRPEDHQVERPGDRRGQPRRDAAGPGHHPGEPLGQVRHHAELRRLPARPPRRRPGATTSATPGRCRAARPPRAPPVSSAR